MDPQNNLPQQENPPVQQEKKSSTVLIILVTIVVTALLVGGGFYLWQDYQKDIQQLEEENTALKTEIEELKKVEKLSCVDSDVNDKPDDILIKGSVTYIDKSGKEVEVFDECSGSKLQVNEMWCYESPAGSGNFVSGKMVYDCPEGCLDGACIK